MRESRHFVTARTGATCTRCHHGCVPLTAARRRGIGDQLIGEFDVRRLGSLRLAALAASLPCLLLPASASATADIDLLVDDTIRFDGAAAGDDAGTSAPAGDVNGDGYDDIIVGAPGANHGGADAGAAYVLYGRPGINDLSLASLGTSGFRIDGAAPSDFTGSGVAGVGDLNGDGYDDVVVGAPGDRQQRPHKLGIGVCRLRAGGRRSRRSEPRRPRHGRVAGLSGLPDRRRDPGRVHGCQRGNGCPGGRHQ